MRVQPQAELCVRVMQILTSGLAPKGGVNEAAAFWLFHSSEPVCGGQTSGSAAAGAAAGVAAGVACVWEEMGGEGVQSLIEEICHDTVGLRGW